MVQVLSMYLFDELNLEMKYLLLDPHPFPIENIHINIQKANK